MKIHPKYGRSISFLTTLLALGLWLPGASADYLQMDPPPDADKAFLHGGCTGEDESCWLATAANMLAGAGYGGGRTAQERADEIYAELLIHYPQPERGWTDTALNWWLFDSPYNAWPDNPYREVTVCGNKWANPWLEPNAPQIIGNHLRDGHMVGLGIYHRSRGDLPGSTVVDLAHAITAWGDNKEAVPQTTNPSQIWVTDSDVDTGDVQRYDYNTYSVTGGWGFSYATLTATLEDIVTLSPLSRPDGGAGTRRAVGSYRIVQDQVRSATALHYTVGPNAGILGYRTQIDWPRPTNPSSPGILESTDHRSVSADWDLAGSPAPNGTAVTITTAFTVPANGPTTDGALSYNDAYWTYSDGKFSPLARIDWSLHTMLLTSGRKELTPDVTGGYVIGAFDISAMRDGTLKKVGEYRLQQEYGYLDDPEHHVFSVQGSDESGAVYVSGVRFGHSYGLLSDDELWSFDQWMSAMNGPYELTPNTPVELGIDWTGRLPYPESVTPNPVPEPSTLALLGIGAIGVLVCLRHARRRALLTESGSGPDIPTDLWSFLACLLLDGTGFDKEAEAEVRLGNPCCHRKSV